MELLVRSKHSKRVVRVSGQWHNGRLILRRWTVVFVYRFWKTVSIEIVLQRAALSMLRCVRKRNFHFFGFGATRLSICVLKLMGVRSCCSCKNALRKLLLFPKAASRSCMRRNPTHGLVLTRSSTRARPAIKVCPQHLIFNGVWHVSLILIVHSQKVASYSNERLQMTSSKKNEFRHSRFTKKNEFNHWGSFSP